MRVLIGILIILTMTIGQAHAEVVEVFIKGFDDGIKTTKQHDYDEAVMNAKMQAIERAGVDLESITKVINFQMKYKAVESKAKAILLPAFQVMDIGYLPDGTYQVVLSGKVQSGKSKPKHKELARDGFFILYENRVVKDSITGLEWVAGPDKDMSWEEAQLWVQSLKIGGGGWRMPTMDELNKLYNKGNGDRNMTPLLKITGWWVWSGETKGSSDARGFYFDGGYKAWGRRDTSGGRRAAAVRSRGDG